MGATYLYACNYLEHLHEDSIASLDCLLSNSCFQIAGMELHEKAEIMQPMDDLPADYMNCITTTNSMLIYGCWFQFYMLQYLMHITLHLSRQHPHVSI